MERKKGYYWIRRALIWYVAYYSSEFQIWELPGIKESFRDNQFEEIDENILTRF